MRQIGRAAAIIAALALLTGCRGYEERKTALVQTVTSAVTLTQGTFHPAATVAPQKTADKPLPKVEKVEPSAIEPPTKCTCVRRSPTTV